MRSPIGLMHVSCKVAKMLINALEGFDEKPLGAVSILYLSEPSLMLIASIRVGTDAYRMYNLPKLQI